MRKNYYFLPVFTIFILAGILAFAQDSPPDKAVVPFSKPGQPGIVEATVHNGGITVKGYNGKEVIVEALVRGKALSEEEKDVEKEKKVSEKAKGMRLVQMATTGLTVEEENNYMEVNVESFKRAIDLTIQVPYSTSLKLNTFNNGDIVVENVNGEIEVDNHNGALKLSGISGAVVANTFNGDVTVNFTKVEPDKPMSFTTWNGDVDVTFPADIKANVKMKSERGDIYTDFEIKITATPSSPVEDSRKEGGKYRISFGEYISGTINGGGPQFLFNTFNGDIFIRKAK